MTQGPFKIRNKIVLKNAASDTYSVTLQNATITTASKTFQFPDTDVTSVTGTGALVLGTSPSFTTPTLGAANATSIKPTTAAAFNFLLNADTNIGSYSTTGAWTLGPAVSTGSSTMEHFFLNDGYTKVTIKSSVNGNPSLYLNPNSAAKAWEIINDNVNALSTGANSLIYRYNTGGSGVTQLYITAAGNAWFVGDVSVLSLTDRTPFPESKEIAFAAIASMQKLPDGIYDPNNKEKQLDHSLLHPYLKSENGRDLSATVSCLAVVVQEQQVIIESLKSRIEALETK